MEEKLYTIPLSRAKTAPKVRRSLSAIKVIKEYLSRNLHIDMDALHMDPSINEAIWSRGNKKIPSKLRVRIVQLEEGIIEASLPGVKTRSEIEVELEKKEKKEKKEKEKKEEEEGKKSKAKGEKQEGKTVDEGTRSSGQGDKKHAEKDDASSKKKSSKNISKKEKEG